MKHLALIVCMLAVGSESALADSSGYFYIKLGVGYHDNHRDDYRTRSPKMGHATFGYQFSSGIFTEISHDSDLQDKDVGYDRIYIGNTWRF